MTSHFAAIGLPAHDAESFGSLCETMFPEAIEDAPPVGARHLLWLDRSGSAVAFHVDPEARVECVTPFFAPPEGLYAWLVGRPVGAPPEKKRSFWSFLRGGGG